MPFRYYIRFELYVLLGWILILLVLFLAGLVLSRLTLGAVCRDRPAGGEKPAGGGGGRLVRSLYRAVITLTSVFFYLSIPLLIALVAGLATVFLHGYFKTGEVPVRRAIVVGAGTLFTLYVVARSLFAKAREEDPGRRLSAREAPRLWALAGDVASRVRTRPVAEIYITPGTEIAVLERGGPLRKLVGKGRRCLLLGLGALPGLSRNRFEAILAHEYGHFSNRDTAGGNLAGRVSLSMRQMGFTLAINGLDKWYNPAWLFLNGFNRAFLRITLGASRLQEILADRYAALAFGVEQFTGGLEHVVRQSLSFARQVANEVEIAQRTNRQIQNVYTLPPISDTQQLDQLEKKFSEVMTGSASPYDSHPSPKERVSLLRGVEAEVRDQSGGGEMWDLMGDAYGLQIEMTGVIQKNVDEHRAMLVQGGGVPSGVGKSNI